MLGVRRSGEKERSNLTRRQRPSFHYCGAAHDADIDSALVGLDIHVSQPPGSLSRRVPLETAAKRRENLFAVAGCEFSARTRANRAGVRERGSLEALGMNYACAGRGARRYSDTQTWSCSSG